MINHNPLISLCDGCMVSRVTHSNPLSAEIVVSSQLPSSKPASDVSLLQSSRTSDQGAGKERRELPLISMLSSAPQAMLASVWGFSGFFAHWGSKLPREVTAFLPAWTSSSENQRAEEHIFSVDSTGIFVHQHQGN